MTADKFAGCCHDLSAGLHYRYAISAKERDVRTTELWNSGHKVLQFISEVIQDRPTVLPADQLNLAINAKVRLARILSAIRHLGSLEFSNE